ncbi:hypothetical protein FKM82_027258 [Ascaphus truei]
METPASPSEVSWGAGGGSPQLKLTSSPPKGKTFTASALQGSPASDPSSWWWVGGREGGRIRSPGRRETGDQIHRGVRLLRAVT